MKIKDISTGSLYKDKQGYLTAAVRVNGKQVMKRVKSEEQAKQWILSTELDRTSSSTLTMAQLNDAANALRLLHEHKVDSTLTNAVQIFLKQSKNGVVTISEAADFYLRRTESRVAPKTLKGYRGSIESFQKKFGADAKVASINRHDAMLWLDQWIQQPASWLANQRALSKFYSECIKCDFASINPFSNLDKPKLKPQERAYLTPEDAKLALQSVAKRCPKYIHFLTLGMFAGIRPMESIRLTKEQVNLQTGYIRLDSGITKSHSYKERVVKMNDTLKAWLKAYPFDEKPIPCEDLNYVERVIRNAAKKDGWPRTGDCFRHSFGTYEFARTGNSAETASMMGHSESIGMKHYRGRVTKEEADRYFAILPKEKVQTELDEL